MEYVAHIRVGDNYIQSVAEHNRNVALLCANSLNDVNLKSVGYILGLLHDMGKYTEEFSEYIRKANEGSMVNRGSVNHTFAAVKYLYDTYHNRDDYYGRLTCEALACVIGSHHGFFDCVSPDGKDGLLHRAEFDEKRFSEASNNFFKYCATKDEVDGLFIKAVTEIEAFDGNIGSKSKTRNEYNFSHAVLIRLLLSHLIDADRRDTADFVTGRKIEFIDADKALWSERLKYAEKRIADFPNVTDIQKARSVFSKISTNYNFACGGIYRLSLPTGGGKTLTALRTALKIAETYQKKHIIFVTPLLSVLDQNAKEIRKYVGDDNIILEHHSNVIDAKGDGDKLNDNELLVENWNSPIIITTLVQLLNVLFDGRTTCVRRMKSLQNAVIVIDEVQSLPKKLLSLFNLTINFLVANCQTNVLLCSATQPCFEELKGAPLQAASDVVPYDEKLWNVFKRTAITFCDEWYTKGDIAAMACDNVAKCGSALIICNKKSEATEIYGELCGKIANVYHLSTSMCLAHRRKVLKEIIMKLNAKEEILCVSTQLVEAGIDFSFGCVIRLFAGLDNIVQAAGRCNRNGEFGKDSPVYVVRYKGEILNRLPDIRAAQNAMTNTLHTCKNEIPSDKSVYEYYKTLFGAMKADETEYPIRDKCTMLSMLSGNEEYCLKTKEKASDYIKQAFKSAGAEFKVFDDSTKDVIVPWGQGAEYLAELRSERAKHDFDFRKTVLDKCKEYTVSLFDYTLKRLQKDNLMEELFDGTVLAINEGCYDEAIGFSDKTVENNFMEA